MPSFLFVEQDRFIGNEMLLLILYFLKLCSKSQIKLQIIESQNLGAGQILKILNCPFYPTWVLLLLRYLFLKQMGFVVIGFKFSLAYVGHFDINEYFFN